jgi:prepilin-type N-terminal cleavage/methylation domain-containing protein
MTTRTTCGRGGFTLLEMTVVMWALGLLLLLGMVTLLGAMRVQKAAATSQERLAVRSALADQFRADVGAAAAASDRLGEWAAGPQCLILRAAGDRHVIYRWREERLERGERAGEGEVAWRRVALGSDGGAVEFTRAGSGGRVITLRLTEPRGGGKASRATDISAALGGDLR